MANTLAAFGFRSFGRLDGGAPTAGFDTLTILSSDTSVIFTGDPVQTSTAATQGFGNYVTAMSTNLGGQPVRGIFMGCEYYSATVNRKVWSPYFPGSVATSCGTADVQAWVCTDPDQRWLVQMQGVTAGSTNVVLASSYMNLNFGFSSGTVGVGNTTTGISAATLASSTGATTNTYPFRLIDFYSNYAPPGTNGTDNTTTYQMVIVVANNWDRNQLTGTG
jgi:hypothetical protein